MSHNQEVTSFIECLNQPWQIEVCNRLRQLVHQSISEAEERMQYKKPHFLKNGQYAAVIAPSKDSVAFMIMNAKDLELPKGQFEGPPERKWLKIREGQSPDYDLLSELLVKASSTL
ncbi:DUF1801 domain-containing protein [Paenibacillus nasutitermitis]|uniref:YdhG-like domain-containing protein n=1 Tax=Paenibacillus nasutitermitis TaxID=1652958 RepID=A0A916YTE1_9BACL|nr:DUF1801 domain-containing protein [Paenibacillus nasutitermitis]GGD60633.1 hypothetical protein GCM10010911_18100 [Paenibacillus nasutitermitis]